MGFECRIIYELLESWPQCKYKQRTKPQGSALRPLLPGILDQFAGLLSPHDVSQEPRNSSLGCGSFLLPVGSRGAVGGM